jgi:hypothetical protein
MSNEKKKRHVFGASSFDVLQDIIINREGGRFLSIIKNRDVSKNMTKADVWNAITAYYNQVIVYSLFTLTTSLLSIAIGSHHRPLGIKAITIPLMLFVCVIVKGGPLLFFL